MYLVDSIVQQQEKQKKRVFRTTSWSLEKQKDLSEKRGYNNFIIAMDNYFTRPKCSLLWESKTMSYLELPNTKNPSHPYVSKV